MTVRPYKLYATSQLEKIHAELNLAVAAWQSKWLPNTKVTLERPISAYTQAAAISELVFQRGEEQPHLVLQDAPDFAKTVYRYALNDAEKINAKSVNALQTKIGEEILKKLVQSLTALATVSQSQERSIDSGMHQSLQKGDGYLFTKILIQSESIGLLISPNYIANLPANKQATRTPSLKLHHRQALLGKNILKMKAQLGEVELRLKDILEIEVGDVLRLNTTINQPIKLLTEHHTLVCHADLGQTAGHKALTIIN